MAEYRTIKMSFWNDPYIEELEAKEKLLYFYLFTGPYASNLGIIEATRRKIAYETALTPSEVDKILERFQAAGKIVCDPERNLIFLLNFIKHQSSTSPKIIEGLQKLAPLVGSPIIAEALYIRYPEVYDIPGNPGDTISIPYAYGIHTLCIPSGEREREREREIGKGNLEEGKGKGEDAPAREAKPSPPPLKQKFGENGFVRLTPEEHAKLCERFSEAETQKAIAFLDLHIGAKGRDEYKSHNLALQKWVFDAVREREAKQRARASPPPGRRSPIDKQQATVDAVNELLQEIEHEERPRLQS